MKDDLNNVKRVGTFVAADLPENAPEPLAIKRGHTYRAKRPRPAGTILEPLVNDRIVRHVDNVLGVVCYDGPAVAIGRHLPRVSIGKFKEWAGRDVTDELPEGKWANWDYRDASKNK